MPSKRTLETSPSISPGERSHACLATEENHRKRVGRILVDLARRGGLDVRSLAKKAKVPLVILQGGSRRPPRAKAIARLAQVVSHLHP